LKPAARQKCYHAPPSPPARGRGLKHLILPPVTVPPSVAPCAGAWIETCASISVLTRYKGRPLRGGVD